MPTALFPFPARQTGRAGFARPAFRRASRHCGALLGRDTAAARLGITRPRLNDLLRGKLGKFSLDALVNLATAAGLTIEIRVAAAA